MEIDGKQEALRELMEKAQKQGYVTFDDIIDCADKKFLPIQEFDWLSTEIATRGIIIYDEVPEKNICTNQEEMDFDDYAQVDYEAVYDKIIQLDNSLEPFITEIRNIIPPQRKELAQLKYQVFEGNLYARERMIQMHLRVAVKMALYRVENYDMEIQDAVSEACIGLVLAVDKYNPDTNGPFSTYASMWILQNLTRYQPTKRYFVYYPVHKKEIYFSAYTILKEYGYVGESELLTYLPVRELLQEKLLLTQEQIDDVLYAVTPFESFEKKYEMLLGNYDMWGSPLWEEELLMPKELILESDLEDKIGKITFKEQLEEALETLTQRDREILKLRYGLVDGQEKTLEEIGTQFYVTRERVRQIERKALHKLRHPSRSRKLKDYLE